VTLYWACTYWQEQQEKTGSEIAEGISLALNRFGTHMLECMFGIYRSAQHDDMRMTKMVEVQATGIMIQEIMKELELHPYIRRHKIDAGCTLTGDNLDGITIDFSTCMTQIDLINVQVTRQKEFERINNEIENAEGDKRALKYRYKNFIAEYQEKCDEFVAPFRELLRQLTHARDRFITKKEVKTTPLSNPRMQWTRHSGGRMAWEEP
jgi:hypothetical protein